MASPNRKLVYLFNWPLLLVTGVLLAIGLLNLFSATASTAGEASGFFQAQLRWILLGVFLFLLMLSFHYRRLQALAWPFYLFSLLLLVAVIFFGHASGGQQNWLVLGSIRLQPSELAKLSTVLLLAHHFSRRTMQSQAGIRSLLLPALILLIPFLLILMVRDLGSAIFFVLIGLSYFFLVGVPKRLFALGLILVVAGGALAYQYLLSDYQQARVQTFLHPEQDPRGSGYHLLQSKIAVGSGQWTGKGFLKGNLNKLKFLPERHTDFVFPVWAEEWGFLGSLVFLGVFGLFFLLLFQAAGKVTDRFGSLLIAGVACLLFWQWFLNLAGVLGLLPLAGITLPFFSYGGSALLTTMIALGLVFNVHMRRYVF